MSHSNHYRCGHSEFEKLKAQPSHIINSIRDDSTPSTSVSGYDVTDIKKMDIYTSYLGKVTMELKTVGNIVHLEKNYIVGGRKLLLKVVDFSSAKSAFDKTKSQGKMPSLADIQHLPSKSIDLDENRIFYVLTLLSIEILSTMESKWQLLNRVQLLLKSVTNLEKSTAMSRYPSLTLPEGYGTLSDVTKKHTLAKYRKIHKSILSHNSAIDIIFNTQQYLDFLFQTTGLETVSNLSVLLSVSNIPDLDNAFFTKEYMVYGDGEKSFYPLTSLDVVAHELSHGLVNGTANLEYSGHSGALNESFADVMGSMFEWYMYEKFNSDEDKSNDILGKADWDIGEDLDINGKYLRSMSDPTTAHQPKLYKGQNYIDPNKLDIDYGGVHINSGIPNHCFYLLANRLNDKNQALKYFIDCLNGLNQYSDLMDFRDTLKSVSKSNKDVCECLKQVGLTDIAISDDRTKDGKKPEPPKCPPCPHKTPCNNPQQQPHPQQQPQPRRYPQQPQRYPQPQPQRYPQQPQQPQRYPQPQQPQRYPQPQPQRYPQPQPQRYPQPQPRRYPQPRRGIMPQQSCVYDEEKKETYCPHLNKSFGTFYGYVDKVDENDDNIYGYCPHLNMTFLNYGEEHDYYSEEHDYYGEDEVCV
jgi:hypothetical protein